jgi:hypothetical protein
MIITISAIIAYSGVPIINIPVASIGRFTQINRGDWREGLKNEIFYPDRWSVC